MILLDTNQIFISNLMMYLKGRMANPEHLAAFQKTATGDEAVRHDLLRHMILNSIRKYRTKFGKKYGEIVLCCDSNSYWRKDVFPHYKASRKTTRQASDLDWGKVFDTLDEIRAEIQETFPYKVLGVVGAEADDIIGALTFYYHTVDDIMIVSADKDFVQLQELKGVAQWNPIQNKAVKVKNPALFLRELIMRGDVSDGIPNFLSADDTFVSGKRQKALQTKKVDVWARLNPQDFCNAEMFRNWKRNQELIDLGAIPVELKSRILEAYDVPPMGDRSKLMAYFMKNKLKDLLDSIGDF